MAELEYFLVAEATSTDSDTNTISIFNVYNERKFEEFPLEIPRLVLVTCWIASQEDLQNRPDMQAEVVLRIPGHPDEGPFRSNFTLDTEFQHVLFEMAGFEIPGPCLVEIELKLNGAHMARHRIRFGQAT